MPESTVVNLVNTYAIEKHESHKDLLSAPTITKIEWILGVDNILEEQERIHEKINQLNQEIIGTKKMFLILAGIGFVAGIINNLLVKDLFNTGGLAIFFVFLATIIVIFLASVPSLRKTIKRLKEEGLYASVKAQNKLPSQKARYLHFKDCIDHGRNIPLDATTVTFDNDAFTQKMEEYTSQFPIETTPPETEEN